MDLSAIGVFLLAGVLVVGILLGLLWLSESGVPS